MNFLTPLAFGLTALLPIIVALYFLKLRREEQRVSSTYLWRTLVRDTAANAPWQRLRPNWLLLLQLLFLAALIFALARPFTWSDSAAGSHLIIVIDTSPSMSATDVKPSRLMEAGAIARRLIASLPSSSRVTIIETNSQLTTQRGEPVEPSNSQLPVANYQSLTAPDFSSALTMAAALAAREADSEVVILSDGHVSLPQNFTLPGRVRFVPIGNANDNQAIGAFSVQTEAGGRTLTAFAQVVNYGAQAAQRRLSLYADGQLATARDLSLPPGKAQALTIPGLPPDVRALEARLEGEDMLAMDDRAWAVPPSSEKTAVRIIGTGNRFLETALRLLPNVETTVQNPTSRASVPGQLPITNYQLTIFDSLIPTDTVPSGNLLFIAPPRSTELFSVTGRIDAPMPAPVVADDPLLRYVDLRDVSVQDASRIALPDWARAVIMDSKSGAPLLIVGEQGGRRLAVLAFDLRRSDLPLRVAFPLLMANLLDALVPNSVAGIPASAEPGRPLVMPAPAHVSALSVRAPDGQTYRLIPQAGRVVFEQTNQFGVYEITAQDEAGKSQTLGRFTVNLFNPDESDITPRETLPIVAASAGAPGDQTSPRARDEWWRAIAWLALAVLVAEWLFAYRGNLARLWELGVRQ